MFSNLSFGTVVDTARRLCSLQRIDTFIFYRLAPIQSMGLLHNIIERISGFDTHGPIQFKKMREKILDAITLYSGVHSRESYIYLNAIHTDVKVVTATAAV